MFEFITFFGSYNFVILFLILFLIFLTFFTKNKNFFVSNFLSLFISIIFTFSVVTLLKNIFQVSGPPGRIIYETDFSFPSAHAAMSTVVFGMFYFLITENFKIKTKNKNFFLIFIILVIFLVSVSRLVLKVHYLYEILFGILIGILGVLLGKIVYKKLK